MSAFNQTYYTSIVNYNSLAGEREAFLIMTGGSLFTMSIAAIGCADSVTYTRANGFYYDHNKFKPYLEAILGSIAITSTTVGAICLYNFFGTIFK